jgi:hypothetical protein
VRSLRRTTEEIIGEIVADLEPCRCDAAQARIEVRRMIEAPEGLAAVMALHKRAVRLRNSLHGLHGDIDKVVNELATGLGRRSPVVRTLKADLRASIEPIIKDLLRNTPGPQVICASFAHRMVAQLSTKAPTGYRAGAFHSIASLLYELATGVRDADLKRACDAMLHEARQL